MNTDTARENLHKRIDQLDRENRGLRAINEKLRLQNTRSLEEYVRVSEENHNLKQQLKGDK